MCVCVCIVYIFGHEHPFTSVFPYEIAAGLGLLLWFWQKPATDRISDFESSTSMKQQKHLSSIAVTFGWWWSPLCQWPWLLVERLPLLRSSALLRSINTLLFLQLQPAGKCDSTAVSGDIRQGVQFSLNTAGNKTAGSSFWVQQRPVWS